MVCRFSTRDGKPGKYTHVALHYRPRQTPSRCRRAKQHGDAVAHAKLTKKSWFAGRYAVSNRPGARLHAVARSLWN